jgi:hypothetical protein
MRDQGPGRISRLVRIGAQKLAIGDVIEGSRGYAGRIHPPTQSIARPNHLEGGRRAGPMVWRIRTSRGMIPRGMMGSAMRLAGRGRAVKHRMKLGLSVYDAAAVVAERPRTAQTMRRG